MSPETQDILVSIAFFLFGYLGGRGWDRVAHDREVAEWKAIARKAQMLNRLASDLEQKRGDHAVDQYPN